MVINNYKPGQLCNRLWYFSYFIANAIEYDYRLIYSGMDDYAQYFESTIENDFKGCKIASRYTKIKFLNAIITRLMVEYCERLILALNARSIKIPFIRFYHIEFDYDNYNKEFNMDDPGFIKVADTNITFIRGWGFKDHKSLMKHAEIIRKFFTPAALYREDACKLIQSCRKNEEVIIGIHIRRGDYEEFENGKWFFEDKVYLEKMKQMEEILYNEGRRCKFLICSNEKLDIESFSELSVLYSERHFIVDLYALAMCDYIIGPPSTFNYWASFYGKVPLFTLDRKGKEININEFMIFPREHYLC